MKVCDLPNCMAVSECVCVCVYFFEWRQYISSGVLVKSVTAARGPGFPGSHQNTVSM